MTVALLIAASLIFTAGWCMGAGIARRKWEAIGYDRAQRDMADDAAVVLALEYQLSLPSREPR